MNQDSPQPVFRFAPSPNGYLHLGHAYSALLNFDLARRMGGRFLLRIENIDAARCRDAFEQAIYEDLAWLGLRWESPVLRQSERIARYQAALESLQSRSLVYPCTCSRARIKARVGALEERSGEAWPRDPDGGPIYPGICRNGLGRGDGETAIAWRLSLSALTDLASCGWREHSLPDFTPATAYSAGDFNWGDVVLSRKDLPGSYHLCVVLDDADQGVSHIVRGMDLQPATAIHRLLQRLFDVPPPLYGHHALLLGKAGEKLSKSIASKALRSLRAEGATPADIRALVGLPLDHVVF